MSGDGLGPDFRWFWAARMVAVVGSALTTVALPVIVYDLTGSAALTSSVTALQVAPYLVLGLLAGAMADRLPRRRVMLGAQAVCAVGLLSVPAAHQLDVLTTAHVLAVTALAASAFVWFDAAAFGALPAIVGRDEVGRANSAIWSASTLLGVGAPGLGGLLVVLLGAHQVLAVDAACYVLAAGCLIAIVRPMGPHRAGALGRTSIRADIGEGVRFLWRHDVIRPLTLLGVVNSVAAGGVTGLLLVLTVERLDGSSGGGELGLLMTVAAVGGFLAATVLPRLVGRIPLGRITLAGLAVGVPAVLTLAASSSIVVAGAALLVWSAGNVVVILNGISLRQHLTPDHLQARVNTTGRVVAWGGTPLGALTCGLLAELTDVRVGVAATAVVLAAGLAYGILAGLRDPEFGVCTSAV